MEYWEFLLQKEGDRSWLPLESPDVEILEGRYRVVARSSRVNTPVEICIRHELNVEQPPKRRVQSRLGQTNRDGLIVVIPFTRMQPGVWELCCRGDLMAEMLGEGWQYAVQLQVLPHEAEAEAWDEPWDAAADSQPSTAQTAAAPSPQQAVTVPPAIAAVSPEVSPETAAVELPAAIVRSPTEGIPEAAAAATEPDESLVQAVALAAEVSEAEPAMLPLITADGAAATAWAEQLSEQLVDSLFEDFEETIDGVDDPEPSPPEVALLPQFRLVLAQEAYAVRRGQSFTLTGEIHQDAAPAAFSGVLRVALRDPQRAAVLFTQQSSLSGRLPLSFDCPVVIPEEYQTHLLLGELMLVVEEETIAAVPFSVTTDLDELLEAIADEFPDSDLLQPPLEFAGVPEKPLSLSFLELIESPTQPPLQFQPAAAPALPPQLYVPDSDRSKPKPLDLPFAGRSHADAAPAPEMIEPPAAIAADLPTPAEHQAAEPPLPTAVELIEALDSPADAPIEWQAVSEKGWLIPSPAGKLDQPSTPEDQAFQSLNLQQRFWSRLSALAGDADSAWLGLAEPHDSPPQIETLAEGGDADLVAQEIVVDDDPPPRLRQSPAIEPPASLVLPKDEPVPTPQLELSASELVAGESVRVTVKLPNLAPRIYAKLWLRDRQTRLLLDGPRWLVDFLPTGLGDVEARADLVVPFGCLEVQIEAIAVEMATQRESHKVSIDRLIVPPNLTALSLDELDV